MLIQSIQAEKYKAWISGNLSFIVYAFMTATRLMFAKLYITFKVKLSFLAALYYNPKNPRSITVTRETSSSLVSRPPDLWIWVLGSVLDSGKCSGFWEVFWILGSVLDFGKCFGFWEVFLDPGKCFWILGSVFGSWEVFMASGKRFGFWEVFWILGSVYGFWEAFWILGSVLDYGKCFVPMGHRIYQFLCADQIETSTSPPGQTQGI